MELIIFMWEKADSHKYVELNSAVKEETHFLMFGFFSSVTKFQNCL